MAWVGALLAVAVILRLTLAPATAASLVGGGFFCLSCGGGGLANILRNVILFVPLGALLVLGGMSVRGASLVALALTAGVESAQQFVPGRNPLLVDLLSNALGGWLGARLAAGARRWIAPGEGRRRRLVAGATGLTAAAALAPAFLLVPDLSGGEFWSQWNPGIGNGIAYPGEVTEARLGGISLPRGPVAEDAAVRAAWLGGEPLSIRFAVGDPADLPPALGGSFTDSGATGLYRLLSRVNGQPVLSVTIEEGRDLRLVQGTRGGRLGLAGPRPLLMDVVGDHPPGTPVGLEVRLLPRGELWVEALVGEGAPVRTLLPASSPASGWSLLYVPSPLGEGGRRLLGLLWCAGLLLLATFWTRGVAEGLAATAGVLGLLAASPLVTPHLALLPWEAGVAGLAGAGAGVAVAAWARGVVAAAGASAAATRGAPAAASAARTVERPRPPAHEA